MFPNCRISKLRPREDNHYPQLVAEALDPMAELFLYSHLASLVSEPDPVDGVTDGIRVRQGGGEQDQMSIATAHHRAVLSGGGTERWPHWFPALKIPTSRVRCRGAWSGF